MSLKPRFDERALAVLAHELRNPMMPIRTAVAALIKQASGDPHLKMPLDILDRQTRWLSVLIDDLVDLAQLARGNLNLKMTCFDLNDLVQEALALSQPLFTSRRHRLSVSLPEAPVRLEGDRHRLLQVLLNLLSNAAKYTDPGGVIGVSVLATDGEVMIQIQDTGLGIAPERLTRIFELFRRGEEGDIQGQEGLGIGLAVVKGVVESHGGRVEAQSAGLGHGATFRITLPRRPADGPPQVRV